jgi:exodeoxyribonuclease V alpha subunit
MLPFQERYIVESMQGRLTRVRYRQPGFVVGAFVRCLPNKLYEEFTVVGPLPEAEPDEMLEIAGEWKKSKKFGRQFSVVVATRVVPTSLEGLERYLAKEVPGVGEKRAKLLVGHFNYGLRGILDQDPQRLMEVTGIGQSLADRIGHSWQQGRCRQQIGLFLADHGINPGWSRRIYEEFGGQAVDLMKANPYRLTAILGIGFKKADEMALKMGWSKDSIERVEASFLYLLNEAADQGDTFVPAGILADRAVAMVSVDQAKAQQALQQIIQQGQVILDKIPTEAGEVELVYLPGLHKAEKVLAGQLKKLLAQPARKLPASYDQALAKVETVLGLELNGEQRLAVKQALTCPVSVLTGKPGTGKTTSVRVLVRMAEELDLYLLLAAPTGRAAKRLAEVSGQPAKTLHRLLEFQPQTYQFARNQSCPLETDVLGIDEFSMADIEMAEKLFAAVRKGTSVVLIGDPDQLPAVGPGSVLKDLMACGKVPVTRLETIFRQAEQSLIVRNAHRIVRGEAPSFPPPNAGDLSDSYLIEAPKEDPDWVVQMVQKLCQESIPQKFGFDPIRQIQVIAPMKQGRCGVHELNTALQSALNPKGEPVSLGARQFRLGDRVMQLSNNYKLDIYNGDLGILEEANPEDKTLTIDFYGRSVFYPYEDADQLALAYALTVHKAQGSEFQALVIVLLRRHFVMLNRNLLYTANTRAKKLVIYVGSRAAIEMAVKNAQVTQRNSLLSWRLNQKT